MDPAFDPTSAEADGVYEELERLDYLRQRLEAWSAEGVVPADVASRLRALTEPEVHRLSARVGLTRTQAPEQTHSVAAATPEDSVATSADMPGPPTASAGLSFEWRDVGTYLLSERTLNGLLGLGGFLILASALAISAFNPTNLSPAGHFGVIVATTGLFLASGLAVDRKLHLGRTGAALLGIGAALVPLDIWTLARPGLLDSDVATTWLATSLLCLPVYLALYLLAPGRAIGVLVAGASASIVLAAGHYVALPLERSIVGLVLLALGWALLAARLRDADPWRPLSWVLDLVGLILVPPVLTVLLAARFGDAAVHVDVSEYAVGAAWWLGVGYFSLSAWLFHRPALWHVAAWLAPVAYLLTLTKAPWGTEWYGVCLGVLAVVYVVGGWWTQVTGIQPRATTSRQVVGQPLLLVAAAMSLAALAWPVVRDGSMTFALCILAAGYALATVLLGLRALAYVATYLLAAVGAALIAWLQPGSELQVAGWLTLSVLGLGAAEWLVRGSGEASRDFVHTVLGIGAWRSAFGSPLLGLGYLASIIALGTVVLHFDRHALGVVALGLILALTALSAILRRSSILHYPLAFLTPVWVGDAVVWAAPGQNYVALAGIWTILGLGSLALGRQLGSFRREYTWPWLIVGFGLCLLAPPWALLSPQLGDRWPRALWLTGVAVLYLAGIRGFRLTAWLYLVVGYALVAYVSVVDAAAEGARSSAVGMALVVPAWILVVLADAVVRRVQPLPASTDDAAGRRQLRGASDVLLLSAWSRPLMLGGLAATIIALALGVPDPAPGLVTAGACAGLSFWLAARWRDRRAASVGIVLACAAYQQALRAVGVSLVWQPATWSALAVFVSLASALAVMRWGVGWWTRPLRIGTLVAALLAAVSTLANLREDAAAVTLGLAGVTWILQGYLARRSELVYVGVGLALAGALVELHYQGLVQLQVYALALGVYLLSLAYLEWRRGSPARVKSMLELAGLCVVLGCSLLQGWGVANDGVGRYAYDVLLLGEAVLLLWLGAVLRWRKTFFAAGAGVILAAATLVAEPLSGINTWYILACVGLGMIGLVLFLEKRRQQLQGLMGAWRQALEHWD